MTFRLKDIHSSNSVSYFVVAKATAMPMLPIVIIITIIINSKRLSAKQVLAYSEQSESHCTQYKMSKCSVGSHSKIRKHHYLSTFFFFKPFKIGQGYPNWYEHAMLSRQRLSCRLLQNSLKTTSEICQH